MVASGRLAFTGRLILGVLVTIYLLFALLLPGEEPQTLKHLQEDIAVKPGEGCEGGEGVGSGKGGVVRLGEFQELPREDTPLDTGDI